MLKSLPKWLRILLFTLAGVIVGGGIVFTVLFYVRGGSPVNVYLVSTLPTIDTATDSQTDGNVRADKLQSVYVSATQKVTEFYVKEGDKVHVGDPILAFDTTLTDIELARKNIAVQQLQLDLTSAKRNLDKINSYQAYEEETPVEPAPPPPLTPVEVPFFRGGDGTAERPYIFIWNDTCSFSDSFINGMLPQLPEDFDPEAQSVPEIYVVFEVRIADSPEGDIQRSWMMHLWRTETGYYEFTMLEPTAGYDGTPVDGGDTPSEELPEEETVRYTWSEIVSMRREAEEKITKLDLELRKAELEYQTLEYELNNGMVYSKIDGVVKALRDPDEARENNEPAVLVSGGGGYYVTGAMSEEEHTVMQVGDTVQVVSMQNNEQMIGTVSEISGYPVPDGEKPFHASSNSNPNTTLFPFTVYLDENANLREGETVQIMFNPFGKGSEDDLYLETMFIRRDHGENYVYVTDENGFLEKHTVVTGRTLFSKYSQILSGVTREDYIAFPYGRNVKEGAGTRVADASTLDN